MSLIDGGTLGAALMMEQQLLVVETHQIEDCRVQVVHVDAVLDGMQAELIGLTNDLAPFDTAAREPHRKAIRVVVAAIPFFGHCRATKFTAPDDECRFQQAPSFEVFQQGRDGLVGLLAEFGVILFNLRMCVPLAARAGIKLYESDSALDQSSSQQAIATEYRRFPAIESEQFLRFGGFIGEVHRLGCM